MKDLKISLKDCDYVVRAKTDLGMNWNNDAFGRFFKDINEELITGQTAYLEITGSEMDPIRFEITKSD